MADDFARALLEALYNQGPQQAAQPQSARTNISSLVGGGIRGAITRALIGLDPPENATGAEMEAYRNAQVMSMAPTPLALAAAPAIIGKGRKGAIKAAEEVVKKIKPSELPAETQKAIAESTANLKLKQQAIKELEAEQGKKFSYERPEGYGSAENIEKRKAEIKGRGPEVLPAAEREANLERMLEGSHVKSPVYHGTNKTDTLADESGQAIKQFDSYVNWFTQDPYHASGYATQDGRQIEGAATYPAYLALQKPLHLRGDLNDKTTYAQFRKETGLDVRPGPYEDEVVDGVEQMIPRWWITNSPSFADAARAAGFDGVIANEGGTKTFGIFYHEPGKIKSAIGNRGTFDVTNPDITKKRGGKVSITDNLDTMRLAVQKRK